MEPTLILNFVFIGILSSLSLICFAQNCSSYTFKWNRSYRCCIDLPYLDAHLHWNYIPTTKKVSVAYRARQSSPTGWIAWAINPTSRGMLGSQALVAFHNTYGSITVYPTPIHSYNPPMLPAKLSFQASNISAEYSNSEMSIFAIIGPLDNGVGAVVNYVWQVGSSVSHNTPQIHSTSPPNLQSMGTIDFRTGCI